jgi:membrane-bound lytic murein transglycosylase MltF
MNDTAEKKRLAAAREQEMPWRKWGPHLLPTLWFRNDWAKPIAESNRTVEKPKLEQTKAEPGMSVVAATHPALGTYSFYCEGDAPHLFTENSTNHAKLGLSDPDTGPYFKDGIDNYVVHGQHGAANPDQEGTEVAAHYRLKVGAGESATVPYSRTLYFTDKGSERGITADFVRDFERYVNKKYRRQLGKRPLTVIIRPTTRDLLLKNVVDGFGDIAAGTLTATDERKKIVDFVAPADQKPVSELVLTGPKSPPIATAKDLSGKRVHVRKASSYYESLLALNAQLKRDGKAPATLVLVPDALEDEDMMEMLNAGLLQVIVVDDWKARIWAQILPNIKIHDGAVVRIGGLLGWAIRKDSPQLAAVLNEYYASYVKNHNLIVARMKQYYSRIKKLRDSYGKEDEKRFEATLALFRKYGNQYRFDPLMLTALGYQESRLDQKARSRTGAIGIMQLLPATGARLKVGDIREIEPNIHAGAKYLDQLMSRYLADADFDETNRTLFAFACYNAGPGNIVRMRKEAKKRGLNPNVWFNNVELVTAEKIGIETTTYVRNIYKYYVAYRLLLDVQQAQAQARGAVNR